MPSQKHTHQLVESIEAKALKNRPWAVRLADNLTGFFGSIGFLLLNLTLFAFWLLANNGMIPGVPIFDPYPFVLLTSTVSLEAIILTVIVMMSQNRSSLISSLRQEMDMQVNLIAEREITKILKLLKILLKEKKVKIEDNELDEMINQIDTSYMERQLTEQLNPKPNNLFQKTLVEPIEKVAQEVEKGIEKTVDSVKSSL